MSVELEYFRHIKKIVIVKKLFLLMLKISLFLLFLYISAIVFFISFLSTKPRNIDVINDYVIEELNKINPDLHFSYDISNSTLKLNKDLQLVYQINNFNIAEEKFKFFSPQITIDIDLVKLIFRKININKINVLDSNLKIRTEFIENKREKIKTDLEQNHDYGYVVKKIRETIIATHSQAIVINKSALNNLKIEFTEAEKTKLLINIVDFQLQTNLDNDNFTLNNEIIFNINNSKINSQIFVKCDNLEGKVCNLEFLKINPYNLKDIFKNNQEIYDYTKNINAIFNLNSQIRMDEEFNFTEGNLQLTSLDGSFYLKEFFDEKINFKNLILQTSFEDNFKKFNINFLRAQIDDTKLDLNLFFKDLQGYKNVDLNINLSNSDLKNLRKLWPNFLGQEEGIRPWVLDSVKSGKSPEAFAKINLKYFPDDPVKSGFQTIYSEVKIENALLNYDSYFPEIRNINGLAIFTEKDMNLKINFANILNSTTDDTKVYIDFMKKISDVEVKSKTKGPLVDLFIHIDKSSSEEIKNTIEDIIEDNYTESEIDIKIPIVDDLDFKKASIEANSKIFNKSNVFIINETSIPASFIKRKNTNKFFGKVDFKNTYLEFLELNFIKKQDDNLIIDYAGELKDNSVEIIEVKPIAKNINFSTDGVINFKDKDIDINIKGVDYKNSNYNINFKSKTDDKITNQKIEISGEDINYTDILSNIKNSKTKRNEGENLNTNNSEHQTNIEIISNIENTNLKNDNKFSATSSKINIRNRELQDLEFQGKMEENYFVKVKYNKENKSFKINSDNFGKLLSTINLTNTIIGGEGEVELKRENGVILGETDIDGNFTIVEKTEERIERNQKIKEDILKNIDKDENFKNLEKTINEEDGISFEKLRGDFSYQNDILTLKEMVASSSNIKFQIAVSGFVNTATEQIDINGLFVPFGILNGFFEVNRIPLISNILFGQKNGGIFASKFTIKKEDKYSETEIDINKFSMILPGFLRNIFPE